MSDVWLLKRKSFAALTSCWRALDLTSSTFSLYRNISNISKTKIRLSN